MLDRLKSLPLTIVLTILIWMYAEAQFTAVHDDVRVNVKVLSPTSDLAVRVYDNAENRYSSIASLIVTLQGPKNQIEQIYQESLSTAPDEEFAGLSYVPTVPELTRALDNGGFSIDVIRTLNRLDYFRSRGVSVTAASPPRVRIEVDRYTRLARTPEFRAGAVVDRFSLSPDTVEVSVPTGTLVAIGGGDKLTVVAEPQRDLNLLPADSDQVVPVRYSLEYPGARDERVRVSPAQGMATVHIPRRQQAAVSIPDIPVWVSGPPALLSRYDVDLQPKSISITVSGSSAPVDALKQRMDSGGSRASGIYAYLDISSDDKPLPAGAPRPSGDAFLRRRLRYVLPPGLSLLAGPAEVGFRLVDHPIPAPVAPPATSPGTPGGLPASPARTPPGG
jgi:hypothetical protein